MARKLGQIVARGQSTWLGRNARPPTPSGTMRSRHKARPTHDGTPRSAGPVKVAALCALSSLATTPSCESISHGPDPAPAWSKFGRAGPNPPYAASSPVRSESDLAGSFSPSGNFKFSWLGRIGSFTGNCRFRELECDTRVAHQLAA